MKHPLTHSAVSLAMALSFVVPPAAAQQQPTEPETPPEAQQEEGQAVSQAQGGQTPDCGSLPDHERLTSVLREVVAPNDPSVNGGLGNHMWAVVVNRQGFVCVVTHSGEEFGEQWPGSRAIAASKAYTANAFSLPAFALSTANLYWPTQPGGPLFGLEASTSASSVVHEGSAEDWGTERDPLVGQRVGGVTVFAGGLALYASEGELVGALGLSGDEACTDHVIAWKMRDALESDHVPDGVTDAHNDNIIHDLTVDPGTGRQTSPSGYGHPTCSPTAEGIVEDFEETHPTDGAP
ncbi:GlcG/HbpS family heme-binding protein [Nitratireductor sp. GCM10026969]|uniref:GlcG/HbpS family heme-binding protein n=1 Tax=Nitratireductor sp. GCM10026969 TaxID=3252645 RepID=UPI003612B39E